jgi:hypothetical protein
VNNAVLIVLVGGRLAVNEILLGKELALNLPQLNGLGFDMVADFTPGIADTRSIRVR